MSAPSFPYLLWQERVAREGAKVGDYLRWLAVQYAAFRQEVARNGDDILCGPGTPTSPARFNHFLRRRIGGAA